MAKRGSMNGKAAKLRKSEEVKASSSAVEGIMEKKT